MAAPKNNQNALKHGGAAAEKKLRTNEEFTGVARFAEQAVRAELDSGRRGEIVARGVARLQAAADLYWAALVDAGSEGDVKRLTSYTKTFGWLQSKALAALDQLRKEEGEPGGAMDYEEILRREREEDSQDD